MSAVTRYSDYDSFAWVSNKHWGPLLIDQLLPVLERLILRHLPAKAHILDLCCGTGQLAQVLIARGYRVTGLDGSEEMLHFARENAPEGDFVLDDARSFKLPTVFDGVVSTYDSLNHVMSLEELTAVFRNVYAVVQGGGYFMFDLTVEEGYRAHQGDSLSFVEDDHVCVIRLAYRPEARVRQSDITIFRLMDGDWKRSDFTLQEKGYLPEEVYKSLEVAGFTEIHSYNAQGDLELSEEGRMFFVCRKPGRATTG